MEKITDPQIRAVYFEGTRIFNGIQMTLICFDGPLGCEPKYPVVLNHVILTLM